MKNFRLTALAAVTLALAACGGGNGPGNVIVKMNEELCSSGDPSTIAKYASQSSQPVVGMITAVMSEPAKAEEMKKQVKEGCEKAKPIEILEEKIDGDKATVRFRNPEGEEETQQLIRENGEWKLVLTPDK
jgi:cellobiose-specific phosphotransferase system component IIB